MTLGGNARHDAPRLDVERPTWQNLAACRGDGNEPYFPDSGGLTLTKCPSCPVRVDCLEFALDNNIGHGIWGGVSERGRRRMRKARRGKAS